MSVHESLKGARRCSGRLAIILVSCLLILCAVVGVIIYSSVSDEPETPSLSIPEDDYLCSCGMDEAHLSDHADSCVRKQYISSLFENKTAEEVYAQWENVSFLHSSDLLSLLRRQDLEKYRDLLVLMEELDSSDITEQLGLQLKGIADDISVSAMSMGYKGFHDALFDIVGSKKLVFSADITPSLGKDEWQPAVGESVTVSLDAEALGLSEGERIGIIHEHEGQLQELGTFAVKDGKLEFDTTGFSVFYGYTVDFEYDGTWHSMDGGEDIYLSDLISMLNMDLDIQDVADVEFSDPELIGITYFDQLDDHDAHDWNLCSLQPFDTQEVLTLTLRSGEKLHINVYDPTYDGTNLLATFSGETWSQTWVDGRTVTHRWRIGYNTSASKSHVTVTIEDGATVTVNKFFTINPGSSMTILFEGDATINWAMADNTQAQPLFRVNGGTLTIKPASGNTNGTLTINGGGEKNRVTSAIVVGTIDKEWDGYENSFGGKNGSIVDVQNVVFKNFYTNHSTYAGFLTAHPGSVAEGYTALHKVSISNCVIDSCRGYNGAAIYMKNTCQGQIICTNTVIKNCIAYGNKTLEDGKSAEGGIVRSNGNNGTFLKIEKCIFYNNRSGYKDLSTIRTGSAACGAGIYWNAANDLSTKSGYGDTINTSNTKARAYVINCQFIGNKATSHGGAIFNEADMVITSSNATSAPVTGYNKTSRTDLTAATRNITGTLFYRNTAIAPESESRTCSGGALHVATYNAGASAANAADLDLTINENVCFVENESHRGGAFSMLINEVELKEEGSRYSITVDGAIFTNNKATARVNTDGSWKVGGTGGAMFISTETTKYITSLNLVSGTISNNHAYNGGGVYVTDTNVTVGTASAASNNDMQITDNEADFNGGGLYLNQSNSRNGRAVITINSGLISENTAGKFGGGIYQTGDNGYSEVFGQSEITNNTAVSGGGIFINLGGNLTVDGTGKISGNTASSNGGGIFIQTNSKLTVSGSIQISENTALKGGGIYIYDGSELNITGGIITYNHAIGTSEETGAKAATAGVGGGVYIRNGVFTMSGTNVGLHSNDATVAANDAFALGTDTTLNLPDVKTMDLAGWDSDGSPDGWFADYRITDTEYPGAVITSNGAATENTGRYNYFDPDKVEVTYDVLSANPTAYYCLTVGTPHPGYGNLTIRKTLTKAAPQDQVFIFEITGTTRKPEASYSTTVTLFVPAGKKAAEVLIANLPDGQYTVTETAWSWRYDPDSTTVNNGTATEGCSAAFEVGVGNTEWKVVFTNEYSDNNWMSADCYCENWWGVNGGQNEEGNEE